MTTPDPFTYGVVDPLATDPRYTTLAEVKARLGIPVSDLTKDDVLIQSIVAGEYGMDVYFGRSFPDTGTNPQIPGIPQAVKASATQISIAVYKEADAPTGTAGSDAFFGSISVQDTTRKMLERNPIMVGLRISWGLG